MGLSSISRKINTLQPMAQIINASNVKLPRHRLTQKRIARKEIKYID